MPEEMTSQITQLNPDVFTWDLFAVIVIVALTAIWFYGKGRDFIVTTTLGAFISIAVLSIAPLVTDFYIDFGLAEYQFRFLFFLLVAVFFTWIMSINGYFEPYVVPSSWEVPIFVFLFAGLVTAVGISFMSISDIYALSPIVRMVFTGDIMLTAWMVAPMAALLLIRGKA